MGNTFLAVRFTASYKYLTVNLGSHLLAGGCKKNLWNFWDFTRLAAKGFQQSLAWPQAESMEVLIVHGNSLNQRGACTGGHLPIYLP